MCCQRRRGGGECGPWTRGSPCLLRGRLGSRSGWLAFRGRCGAPFSGGWGCSSGRGVFVQLRDGDCFPRCVVVLSEGLGCKTMRVSQWYANMNRFRVDVQERGFALVPRSTSRDGQENRGASQREQPRRVTIRGRSWFRSRPNHTHIYPRNTSTNPRERKEQQTPSTNMT